MATPSQACGLSNAERQRLKKEVASLERKMETRRGKVEELEQGMFAIDPTDFAALTAQQEQLPTLVRSLMSSRWLGSRPASSSRANAYNVPASSCMM